MHSINSEGRPDDNLVCNQSTSKDHKSRRHRRSTGQSIPIAVAIAALLLLSAGSVCRLFASVYADYGYRLAEAESDQLVRAGLALDVAVKLWPLAAEYHNQRGLLAVRAGDFLTAEHAYLRSLELRPTWPYTWANLAQYRLVRGRTDDLLTGLWQQGLELGPAEDRLHLAYSQIGLTNWYRLARQQRKTLRQSLDYLLKAPNAEQSLRELTLFVRRHNLEPLLCRLVQETANLQDWCLRYNSTPRTGNS